jgi:hypothetical protein
VAVYDDIVWAFSLKKLGQGSYAPYAGFSPALRRHVEDRSGETEVPRYNQSRSELPCVESIRREVEVFRASRINREISALYRRVLGSTVNLPDSPRFNPTADSEWLALWSNGGVYFADNSDRDRDSVVPNAGSDRPDANFRVPVFANGTLTARFSAWFTHGFGPSYDNVAAPVLLNYQGPLSDPSERVQFRGGRKLPLLVFESDDYIAAPRIKQVAQLIDATREFEVSHFMLRSAAYDMFMFGWRNAIQVPYSANRDKHDMGIIPANPLGGRANWADTALLREEAFYYWRRKWGVSTLSPGRA